MLFFFLKKSSFIEIGGKNAIFQTLISVKWVKEDLKRGSKLPSGQRGETRPDVGFPVTWRYKQGTVSASVC